MSNQNDPSSISKASDKRLKNFFTVVVMGIGVGVITPYFTGQWLVVSVPLLVLLAVVLTIFPGGFMHRDRHGGYIWASMLGWLVLLSYPILSWWISSTKFEGLWPSLIPVTSLWAASALLSWQTLRARMQLSQVSMILLLPLLGAGLFSLGLEFVAHGYFWVALLAFSLGVGAVAMGLIWLKHAEVGHRRGMLIIGVSLCVIGGALLCAFFATLLVSGVEENFGYLFYGVVGLLTGVSFLLIRSAHHIGRGRIKAGAGGLLFGAMSGATGVEKLAQESLMLGFASLSIACAFFVFGVYILSTRESSVGGYAVGAVAAALTAIASLLYGVNAIMYASQFDSHAFWLVGISFLVASVAFFLMGAWWGLGGRDGVSHHLVRVRNFFGQRTDSR